MYGCNFAEQASQGTQLAVNVVDSFLSLVCEKRVSCCSLSSFSVGSLVIGLDFIALQLQTSNFLFEFLLTSSIEGLQFWKTSIFGTSNFCEPL